MMAVAYPGEDQADMSRIASLLLFAAGALCLAATVAVFGLVQPSGRGFRDELTAPARQQALQAQPTREHSIQEIQQRAAIQRQLQQQRAALAEAGQRVFIEQQWTDGQLERSVFQQYATASGARRQLDRQLARRIIDIDRTCELTDAQKKKLQLAGRGDIKRFFDSYEEVKRKAEASEQDEGKVPEVWQEIGALNLILFQTGLFHEDSLLVKSLRNTLTGEQFARYDALAREGRASRHRKNVENAVALFQRGFDGEARHWRKRVLRDEQRQRLIGLLNRETKPSPKPGPHETQVILVQFARLPEQKLKQVFDEDQWQTVIGQFAGYWRYEPMLKRSGLMPVDDDRGEAGDERLGPGRN
jgi:hypothetical protein